MPHHECGETLTVPVVLGIIPLCQGIPTMLEVMLVHVYGSRKVCSYM